MKSRSSPNLEHAEVAEISAVGHGLAQSRRQRLHVPKAQVHALPRQRVDRVRCVAE